MVIPNSAATTTVNSLVLYGTVDLRANNSRLTITTALRMEGGSSNILTSGGTNQQLTVPTSPTPSTYTGSGSGGATGTVASFVTNNQNTTIGSFTALPVKLRNFSGENFAGAAKLKWSVAEEIDFDYYLVERSQNSINFEAIGLIKPNSSLEYNFSDENPLKGINYYRLKMQDLSGLYAYSKIIAVNFDQYASLNVYPNPTVNGEIFVDNIDNAENLKMLNAKGQIIRFDQYQKDGGFVLKPHTEESLVIISSGLTSVRVSIK